MTRKTRAVVCALALILGGAPVSAQDYPTKPVQVMVGMPPGGSIDIFARLVGEQLSRTLGQQFVVENRTGANQIIATDIVAKARPDGHTLMMAINSHVTNGLLYQNLNYDPIASFVPVALIARTPFVFMAHPSLEANSVDELIKLSHKRKVTFGTPGLGSIQHLAIELLMSMSDAKMAHIPYKGGAPVITDIVGGHIDLGLISTSAALPYINTGRAKAIAVSSLKRSNEMPNVPTIDESGIRGYEADVWFGILAPAKTPDAVVQKLNKTIRSIMAQPDMLQRLASLDAQSVDASPKEFGDVMRNELEKWSKVIKERGIKIQQ